MKVLLYVIMALVFLLGCARVRVEAPKEPIKVDISMRLDIYQHVAKDIDDIENIVSGQKEKAKTKDRQSWLNYFVRKAYAQEGLSPEVEQAALRRKDRKPQLNSWQEKGIVGENKSGLVETKGQERAEPSLQELARAENSDRMIIYQAVAQKNGATLDEVKKLYAKRLQADASIGTPIEVFNANTGNYEWQIKK